jgi:hypothetical protein
MPSCAPTLLVIATGEISKRAGFKPYFPILHYVCKGGVQSHGQYCGTKKDYRN